MALAKAKTLKTGYEQFSRLVAKPTLLRLAVRPAVFSMVVERSDYSAIYFCDDKGILVKIHKVARVDIDHFGITDHGPFAIVFPVGSCAKSFYLQGFQPISLGGNDAPEKSIPYDNASLSLTLSLSLAMYAHMYIRVCV